MPILMPTLLPPARPSLAPDRPPELLGPDGRPMQDQNGFLLAHYRTFAAIYNAIARTYSFRYDEALRQLPADALAMRRDVYIRSLVQERAAPTAALAWRVAPDNTADRSQVELARRVGRSIQSIRRFTLLRRVLLEAIWYGRYGVQVLPRPRPASGPEDPGWSIAAWKPVNGDKIQFTFEDVPQIAIGLAGAGDDLGPYQQYGASNIVTADRFTMLRLSDPAWRRRFIIHRHEIDDADYFEGEMAGGVQGVGVRHVIYWGWWMRDECLSWALNYMQKVGTLGLLIFWYDANDPAAKLAAETAAAQSSHESAFAAPRPAGRSSQATAGVDLLPASTAGINALISIISEYFERHIERYIIGQSMSAGADHESGLGGSGRAQLAADTKYQLLKFDAENLDDTLSADLVMPLAQLIAPEADFPLRFESSVPDPAAKDRLDGATAIVEMGVPLKRGEVFEQIGLTVPGPEDDVLGGAAAAPGAGGGGLERPDLAQQVRRESSGPDGAVGYAAADDPSHPGYPKGAAGGKGGEFRRKDDGGGAAAGDGPSATDAKGPRAARNEFDEPKYLDREAAPTQPRPSRRVGAGRRRARAQHRPNRQGWMTRRGNANESRLAKLIGGLRLPDSEPADVIHVIGPTGAVIDDLETIRHALRINRDSVARGKPPPHQIVGVELKTFLTTRDGQIRMSPAARERKERWAQRYGAQMHTVIFDQRRGQYYSGRALYWREGVGPFKIGKDIEAVADDSVLRRVLTEPRIQEPS